jgi:membrane protein
VRIELFDRSMAIAAQVFTSVLPILIVSASWVAADGGSLADTLGVPDETQSVLDEAMGAAAGSDTFGVVGTLAVLASATSLSRALTRAFAAIWELPRATFRLSSAWRWVAVVLALVLMLVTARALTRYLRELPPPTLWQVTATLALDVAIAVFVPWLLLSGQVRPRHLLPGAFVFGVAMLALRPASAVWIPHALQASQARYGSIGVAFTYLAWLYVVSFCLLTASVMGQVVTSDQGRFGHWLRGKADVPPHVPSSETGRDGQLPFSPPAGDATPAGGP